MSRAAWRVVTCFRCRGYMVGMDGDYLWDCNVCTGGVLWVLPGGQLFAYPGGPARGSWPGVYEAAVEPLGWQETVAVEAADPTLAGDGSTA